MFYGHITRWELHGLLLFGRGEVNLWKRLSDLDLYLLAGAPIIRRSRPKTIQVRGLPKKRLSVMKRESATHRLQIRAKNANNWLGAQSSTALEPSPWSATHQRLVLLFIRVYITNSLYVKASPLLFMATYFGFDQTAQRRWHYVRSSCNINCVKRYSIIVTVTRALTKTQLHHSENKSRDLS